MILHPMSCSLKVASHPTLNIRALNMLKYPWNHLSLSLLQGKLFLNQLEIHHQNSWRWTRLLLLAQRSSTMMCRVRTTRPQMQVSVYYLSRSTMSSPKWIFTHECSLISQMFLQDSNEVKWRANLNFSPDRKKTVISHVLF